MIVALQIGKGNSQGLPGKNIKPILGRPLMEYPLMAAKNCDSIDKIFISTDSDDIGKIASKYDATRIYRPEDLSKSETLTEDVLIHALEVIRNKHGINPEIIVLLFCNVATTTTSYLDQSIEILRNDSTLDSVFSVREYNMFSPIRARKLNKDGLIESYVDLSQFENISSIRDDQETCYYLELGIQVLRPNCIDNIWDGMPPAGWLGNKSYGLVTDGNFDVDAEWQFPVVESWLRNKGFTDSSTPYDQKK